MLSERSTESDVDDSVVYIVGGVVGGVSVLILIVVVSRRCRRRRRRRSSKCENRTQRVKTSRTTASSVSEEQALTTGGCSAPVVELEIAPSAVRILRRVGNARFGTVYIGNVVTSPAASNPVIVQTVAGGADAATREFFVARTRAMARLRHRNVLGLVGACLQQTAGPSAMVSALYDARHDGVDLNTFLQCESRSAVVMKLAAEAACGLAYLSQHSVTPAQVSAASVLVATVPGCGVTAQVCDLGLASPWCCCSGPHHRISCAPAAADSVVWPHRAVAPELQAAHGHHDLVASVREATGVWQFGVVLYQIHDVIGHQHLVAIATDCCSDCPVHRPRFADVHRRLLLAAGVTSDPVIDRLTGEVIWECDLHSGSPATSNETGYSLLTALAADTTCQPSVDDGLISQHLQPCCPGNGEMISMINDETGQDSHRRVTLPRSLSSHTSSHII